MYGAKRNALLGGSGTCSPGIFFNGAICCVLVYSLMSFVFKIFRKLPFFVYFLKLQVGDIGVYFDP